jgi:hypothetical protein
MGDLLPIIHVEQIGRPTACRCDEDHSTKQRREKPLKLRLRLVRCRDLTALRLLIEFVRTTRPCEEGAVIARSAKRQSGGNSLSLDRHALASLGLAMTMAVGIIARSA